jgi:hypothetical protein
MESGRAGTPPADAYRRDLDEANHSGWLFHQEQDDQGAKNDLFDVLQHTWVDGATEHRRSKLIEQDRKEDDENCPDERSCNAAKTAQNDYEENLKGSIEVEAMGFDRAEIRERPKGSGDAAVK